MKKFNLSPVELMSNNETDKLIGGFSVAIASSYESDDSFMTNNCHAGNCSTKSCKKYKQKKIPGTNNCGKNCVSSWGSKV